jgi:4-alpha-glucanotransferase
VSERPNVPGTANEHPNWSLALPAPLEDVVDEPAANAVLGAVTRR